MTDIESGRLIFVGGLHRSGTTALGRILAEHPSVSGFRGTEAEEDEGQHLQDVYRAARSHGGPGRFARAEGAHLTALGDPAAAAAREQLLRAWTPHWDLARPFLVEKSPPNVIMGQYLQSVFPGSALVVILRNPVIVALSTKKWRRTTTLHALVEHWFLAHDILRADAAHLERLFVLRYEDLVASPSATLGWLAGKLSIPGRLDPGRVEATRSDRYLETWEAMRTGSVSRRRQRRQIESAFGERMLEYGYSLEDLGAVHAWSPIGAG